MILLKYDWYLFDLLQPSKPQDFDDVKASFVKRVEDLFEDISNKFAELET